MARRKGGFFTAEARPADEEARRVELEALVAPRRTVVQDLPVERIEPNPFQARRDFGDVAELAQAIRALGFTSRLRVRPHPEKPGAFQLVYGERRLRAAREAGLAEVPCEIGDHNDADLIEIGLAENIQRRDLAPLEEARAFATFIEQRGYSVRSLAERIGKDKSYVEDRLALLRMPEDVQNMVAQRPDSLRAAREIARVTSPEARQPLIGGVVAGSLSTADVRAAVREPAAPAPEPLMPIQRIVERDRQAMQVILARWRTLVDQEPDGREAVAAALAELVREAERLAEALGG